MKVKTFLKNRRGSSVLLVLGLLSAVSIGFYQVSSQQASKMTELVNERAQRYYVEMYLSLMESILRNPEACSATFAGTVPSGDVAQIRVSAGGVSFPAGHVFGQNRANATRITLSRISWSGAGDANGKELELTFITNAGKSEKEYRRLMRVNYILTGGTVAQCAVSDAASLAQACGAFNGTLVNSVCSNPRVMGTTNLNGTVRAQRVTVAGTATANNTSVTTGVSSASLRSTNSASMTSLSAASLMTSGSMTTNSINVGSFPVCASGGCQTWTTRTCPAGRYMYAINASEGISCAAW